MVNDLDYYIKADNASKAAYDIGDLIRELPYRKKKNEAEIIMQTITTKLHELNKTLKSMKE